MFRPRFGGVEKHPVGKRVQRWRKPHFLGVDATVGCAARRPPGKWGFPASFYTLQPPNPARNLLLRVRVSVTVAWNVAWRLQRRGNSKFPPLCASARHLLFTEIHVNVQHLAGFLANMFFSGIVLSHNVHRTSLVSYLPDIKIIRRAKTPVLMPLSIISWDT